MLALAILALGATPASAEYIHGPVNAEFGPTGAPSPGWGSLNTLAYQQAEKRIYVLADNAIYGFSNPSAGTLTPLGGNFPIGVSSSSTDSDIAVDNSATGSAGRIIYNADGPTITGYNSTGVSLGLSINAGSENCGVAVDNEGHIWGGTYGSGKAQEWGSGGGAAINSFLVNAVTGQPCKIGVDNSNNDVYVSGYGPSKVAKFTKASNYASFTQLAGLQSSNNRVTVNATRHVVYVGSPNGNKVFSYDAATGSLLESFTISGGNVRGLAVQDSTDTVFVANSNGKVQELRGIAVPKATTGEPTGNQTVSGIANTDSGGPIIECYFEFGPTTAYGSTKTCDQSVPITEGESPKAVTATLPGLLGEETYHYRLVLGNANGQAKGVDNTITPHNVKGLKSEAATEVTRTTAKLNGSFEGTNETTTYYFQYGLTTEYGSRSPAAPTEKSAGKTTGLTALNVSVSELKPDTTYHFRVVGKNPIGISPGKDLTFKTLPSVQGVTTEKATNVTKNTATLTGSFTGNGEAHTFYFEWGPTTAYGHVIGGPAGNAVGKVSVSEGIAGLTPYVSTSTPYHYRLVATNSTGSTVGGDQTFFPAPPDLPQISDTATEEVSPTSARVKGTINPGEGETVFIFEYGPDTNYESATPNDETLPGDTSDHPVSALLTELTPGTTYHFRVVALNFGGTSEGPDQTFTTPDVPTIGSSGASAVGQTTVHLSAVVAANASPTNVHFEYGPAAAYGQSTSPLFVGQGMFGQAVDTDIGGLSPATTYHFRAVAINGIGTANAPDQTFTTQPAPTSEPEEPRPPCRKGFVRRHGKCVKRHRGKHTNRRKHHRHSTQAHD